MRCAPTRVSRTLSIGSGFRPDSERHSSFLQDLSSSANERTTWKASDRAPWFLPSHTTCAESGTAIPQSWYSTSLVSRRHIQLKLPVQSRRLISIPSEAASCTVCLGFQRKRSRLHLHPPTDSQAQKQVLRHRRRAVRRYLGQDYPVFGA